MLINALENKEIQIMRELSVNEVNEVHGGNPAVVILIVRVAKVASPYVKTAIVTAAATIAGAAGYDKGSSDE